MKKRSNACLSTVIAVLLLLTAGCSVGDNKKLNRESSARLLNEYLEANDRNKIRTIFSEGPTFASITIEDRSDVAMLDSELAHVKAIPKPFASDQVCLYLTETGRARAEKEWEEKEYEWDSDATEDCPYDKSWLITLGALESLEVTGIQTLSDTSAKVEFDVQYSPNEVGEILREQGLENPSWPSKASTWEDPIARTASLELYDDGWRVTNIGD